MGEYHYLASSLPELEFDKPLRENRISTQQLFLSSMEEMPEADFDQVRTLFLFNDIKNTVFFQFNTKKQREDFVRPSFYEEQTFMLYKNDPASFLPFIALFYELKTQKNRIYPQLPETDELTAHFYADLDDLTPPGFLRNYFTFLCNLRNIASAVAFRSSGLPISSKLIPWGEAYERIHANENAPDFGLGGEFSYALELIRAGAEGRLAFELAIDRALWDWLDEELSSDFFSLSAILGYFVRLASVERWEALKAENGESLISGIMNNLGKSIRFSIEFNKTGDR